MTDRDDPALDDPAFDDPAHADLRRLLASARVDSPMPDDVARRLDDTLATLHREPSGQEAAGAVVPLRRRLAPRLLAAAAALVVLGGVGTVVAQQLGSTSEGGTAATGDAASATSQSGAPKAQQRDAQGPVASAADLPEVRPDHLRTDAAGVLSRPDYRTLLPEDSTSAGAAPDAREAAPPSGPLACPGPSPVRGPSIVVRYGTTPAALVLRPAGADARRTVEIWSCSGDTRLAHAVLPAGLPAGN